MMIARVLVLNASYEPLTVVSVRRALALVMRGQVTPATDERVTVRGVADEARVPAVIRLRHYVHVPRRGAHWSRRGVLGRDGYHCIYCGAAPGDVQDGHLLHKENFTVDHIIPRSRGGENTWSNTVCACHRCNQRKGNRMPHEAGMLLRWEPKMPRVSYLVVSGEIPAAWRVYIEV